MWKLKAKGGLGFRDLAKFNIALLAKRGWKLTMQPYYFFARGMKTKYYPNSEFLKASLGSHPSYTWRSIWSARGLLEEGLGWRVDNSKSINVWNEAWVLGLGPGRITGQTINIYYTTVADLINNEQSTWKTEVRRKIFDEDQIRNKAHHQGEKLNTFEVIKFIKAYHVKSNIINTETSIATRQINSIWVQPRADMITYNFGTEFCNNTFKSVMGILFKDCEGHILVACIYHNIFIADATTEEVKACLQAVSVSEELGFRNLIVEGDSLTVIKNFGH
ncbi:hypothetical protein PVK06_024441 [Gossypium arboreum]|uniref:RNase H type-1 domain-containing protein n=1 Tax=Gossypium arboreum TaxID=29729 RepID=A0ABR0PDR2_GOSAR|nr:hypothetical protein PVK06_024441 [Gossypium arboreum]